MQNFFELYKALNEDDYAKMTTCTFCQRKFRFTSVLIDHMSSHAANVENIVEMKLKIWVNGSKLKCSEPGCKKKFAYRAHAQLLIFENCAIIVKLKVVSLYLAKSQPNSNIGMHYARLSFVF